MKIAAARALEVGKTIELVSSLKLIMIDTNENSPWYTFTISSFDGMKWTKNVTGDARALTDKSVFLQSGTTTYAPFPRKVDEQAWYSVLAQLGLNYTGWFKGMRCISAAANTSEVIATVSAIQVPHDERHSLYPAVIDQCFQVFTVAAARGLRKNIDQLVVPTFIGEMVVCPSTVDLDVMVKLRIVCRGSFVVEMEVQSAGVQVLHLKDYRTSALTSCDEGAEENPLISQLQWKPHADLTNLDEYMHPVEPRPNGICYRNSHSHVCLSILNKSRSLSRCRNIFSSSLGGCT